MKLNKSQIEEYNQSGALVIPDLFPDALMDKGVDVYSQVLKRFAEECEIPFEDYRSVISQVRDLWKHDSLFQKLIFESTLPQIAAQLMNRPAARLLHDHIISKPQGNSSEVPWHQDYPYWPVDHNFGLSCWLAMDDVDSESGALEIIPGSHLSGEEAPVDFMGGQRADLNIHPKAIRLPVKKGDVVILHSLTWHRTGPNNSLPNRRAYISLWIPPESRYAPLHADWHPVNYNIHVAPGQLLNQDWFPVVGELGTLDLEKYPPGRLKFHGPEVVDEDFSMFNASVTVRKRLQEMLARTGKSDPEILNDVHSYLINQENRDSFVSDLHQMGALTDTTASNRCLQELAINSIAWSKHKARNVYNQGYVEFKEMFGL
jgi:ectoine hydroxylase-related dioxygenase (phytanoyl-CoA dioxygenase family)